MNPVELLTQRERDCLRLVDQHLSSKQIARELGMSKTSVDTYCDRARRKLGVDDRFQAARLLRDQEVNPVLIGSGHDAIRTDIPEASWPDEPATKGASDGPAAELREPSRDWEGPAPSPGDRRLRGAVAGLGEAGGAYSELLLDAARAAARRSLGDARSGGHGEAPGFREPEAGPVQAAGNGASGNPLPDVGSPRRELQGRARAWSRRNELSPALRIGAIVGIAVVTVLAFGGMLAGLHYLNDLAASLLKA
ncbi:response regulator transcription factor [Phenylobacterium sp.]|uniref:response regulator transcription factor n=1 Tax=Phenylobacterium sp. TaxID=1871053 RepID=UPI0025EB55F9|nr:helix-turn-helix transcriptional regulator [Phenylobacterium sp.]